MSVIESIPGHYTGHLAEEVEGRATELAMGHLRELAGRYSSIRKEIRHGKPADELIKFAEENEIECIVIASHKPGLSDYFLGSTAARVVRHAPCTVLVMR